MTIVNLTPHEVKIIKPDGTEISFPPSGQVARIEAKVKQVGEINGIPCYKIEYGEPVGLPEEQPGTIYIVSSLVLGATNRKDVVAPNTNNAVRDSSGKIIGVPGFIVK